MNPIEVKNISKVFECKHRKVKALDRVSLTVKKGEIYGLLGPNGAGKTTLVNILCTLILPDSGTAKILGKNVVKNPVEVKEKLGVCFGGSRFNSFITGKENLKFYGYLNGMGRIKLENRINELASLLGFKEFFNRRFGGYSKGMKQKITIAKSLLNDPDVLLMDEPTVGLDVEIAMEVRDLLKDLVKEQGTTILLTSHYLHEIEELCKKITMINQGKVVVKGNIKAIKKKLKFSDNISFIINKYTNLGFINKIRGVKSFEYKEGIVIIRTKTPKNIIIPLLKQLKRRKIRFKDLEIRPASLEEVVLKIMKKDNRV